MDNLIGVVLCGGESKRMGADKGLIKTNDTTWAQLIAAKLSVFNIPVIISINHQQLELYNEIFPQEQLVIDHVDIKGPLKGLLSVHEKFPSKDILLMACDLIDMDQSTLKNLIETYHTNQQFDFFVYKNNDFTEPFCAIYTSKGLKPVLQKAMVHALEKFSFQNVLEEGNTKKISVENTASFRNHNSIPGHHRSDG